MQAEIDLLQETLTVCIEKHSELLEWGIDQVSNALKGGDA
jgi:hypothetical protein